MTAGFITASVHIGESDPMVFSVVPTATAPLAHIRVGDAALVLRSSADCLRLADVLRQAATALRREEAAAASQAVVA